MYEATWYVWAMISTAVVGFAISIGVVVNRGALADEVDSRSARRAGVSASMMLIAWTAVSAWLAGAGYYSGDAGVSFPLIPIAFSLVLVGLLSATRVPVISRALASPGTIVRLTLPHTLRVIGAVFLIVMAQGDLPGDFALPAGLGDIAIGVAAPIVAWRLARGKGIRGAVWFNILGLADLAIAITVGFFAASGPFQILDAQPSTDVLAMLPIALVPTVAVPVAITLHILSLRRLRRASSSDGADHLIGAGVG
jgi:hypothetical protein